MKIYNGDKMLLGRLASVVAKDTLLGEEVTVVNCEKIMISGKKHNVFAREKQRHDRRGYPLKSAVLFKVPDKWTRRTIRGMLPWKIARGKEAFRKIRCYNGIPEQFQGKELITLQKASIEKLPTLNYISLGDICRLFGRKL